MVEVFKPFAYQPAAIRHLINQTAALYWLDMGKGKTACVLTAFLILRKMGLVKRLLVIAPINVIEGTWPDEIKKWQHTQHLTYSLVRGGEIDRIIAMCSSADIMLINYEFVPDFAAFMHTRPALLPDMLVMDESAKLKSPKSHRFKFLRLILKHFKRRVAMSGTPVPDHVVDIFSQVFCVDLGERLGTRYNPFLEEYFTENQYSRKITPKEGTYETLVSKVRDITYCLTERTLDIPEPRDNVIRLALPDKLRPAYATFERDMVAQLRLEGRSVTLEALSRATCSNRLRQFCSGAVYNPALPGAKPDGWQALHTVKMDRLADIVEDAQGEPITVLYEFRHEAERYRARWPKAEFVADAKPDWQKRWNSRKIPLLFSHYGSISHGLNLQYGGHILVIMTMPWSSDALAQSIKRFDRPGQTRQVIYHRLVLRDTIEERVCRVVAAKADVQAGFLAALSRDKLTP